MPPRTERRPLTSRPLDLVYFTFFLFHVPATLLLDLQALYPPSFLPSLIAQLPRQYLAFSGDPLIAGSFGFNGPSELWAWFKTFLWIEAVFQLPTFVIAARGLWRDSRSPYLLLLILVYGAATAPTTLACLSTILAAPSVQLSSGNSALSLKPVPLFSDTDPSYSAPVPLALSDSQRSQLVASFVPFFVVPLLMAVDMGLRLARLAVKGVKAEALERKAGKKN